MILNYSYIDDQYPVKGNKHSREIARALLYDENGNFALHHLIRDDGFGKFDYYETPGGGIDEGETPEEAVVREILEETGYKSEVVEELAFVKDYYNLINRENLQHFFLCKTVGKKGDIHFMSRGDLYIKETIFVPLEEVIRLYETHMEGALPILVQRRELPIFKQLVGRKLF